MALRPWEAQLMDEPEKRDLFWNLKKTLEMTWSDDCKTPRRYPLGTSLALAEFEEYPFGRPPRQGGTLASSLLKTPLTLAELLSEENVKRVWEENNSGTFHGAIVLAANASNVKEGWQSFKTIIRAMETAYVGKFVGPEVLAMPRVNILHTGIDKIARVGGLENLTEK